MRRLAALAGCIISLAFPANTLQRPMPCQEDEVYVWLNARTKATCVTLDDFASRASIRKLDRILEKRR